MLYMKIIFMWDMKMSYIKFMYTKILAFPMHAQSSGSYFQHLI